MRYPMPKITKDIRALVTVYNKCVERYKAPQSWGDFYLNVKELRKIEQKLAKKTKPYFNTLMKRDLDYEVFNKIKEILKKKGKLSLEETSLQDYYIYKTVFYMKYMEKREKVRRDYYRVLCNLSVESRGLPAMSTELEEFFDTLGVVVGTESTGKRLNNKLRLRFLGDFLSLTSKRRR